jgi:diketogulonate reductase-like aldo/keto reductase
MMSERLKQRIIPALIFIFVIAAFSGCGTAGSPGTDSNESGAYVSSSAGEADSQSESDITYAPEFDFETQTVTLNDGKEMPILGIGTFHLSQSEAENSVYWALRDGYRLIDTAEIYGNEEGVGRGIQRAIDDGYVTRGEIFVTTKLWTDYYDDADEAIDDSLERLGLDYIDLMILHHSQPSNDVEAYHALENAVSDGRLRSIGLSNYYTPDDFDRLVSQVNIMPAVLQNETHLYHQSTEMKNHIAQYGTIMESWFPLGGRGHTQELFNNETVVDIAETHGKTSPQIILRWQLQSGNIAIPGSSNENHIAEDYDIFDFELTEEEMNRLNDLDRDERFADY